MMPENISPLLSLIDEYLAREGLSARQFSERIGLSHGWLTSLRTGRVLSVRPETATRIAAEIGIDADQVDGLAGLTGVPSTRVPQVAADILLNLELDAIETGMRSLSRLDLATRRRVLSYLAEWSENFTRGVSPRTGEQAASDG